MAGVKMHKSADSGGSRWHLAWFVSGSPRRLIIESPLPVRRGGPLCPLAGAPQVLPYGRVLLTTYCRARLMKMRLSFSISCLRFIASLIAGPAGLPCMLLTPTMVLSMPSS